MTGTIAPAAPRSPGPPDAPGLVREVRRGRARQTRRAVALLVLALFAAMAVRVLLGRYTVTVPDFFAILGGAQIPGASFIVLQEKLPRAVLGALAGAALGCSGALFRRVLRNPLASPDILGITYGAAAGAVAGTAVWGLRGTAVSWTALAGALLAATLIATASVRLRTGGIVGERFLLAGIGVAALAQALTAALLVNLSLNSARDAALWTAGSLNAATWDRITVLGTCLLVAVPAALAVHRALEPAELGLELASGLGAHPGRSRALALGLGVVLAAVATAATGPLAFVALMSTPVATALTRGRTSILACALVGAVVVVVSDAVGSELLAGTKLPAGVVTGAVGAPVMLWLLVRQRRGDLG
ncbi:FecCD family ABC transporter permease [Kocuria sp. M1R5S2]|uniref:FecCD family ABC transporter permease n=1 Tax=Kocuria rhizosphaerae TaxID=3376285 RepID=UPI0037A339B8